MPNTFNGGLAASEAVRETFGSGPFSGSSVSYPPLRFQSLLGPGTAADQSDGWSAAIITLAASTPFALDLTTLVDPENNALTVARIRRASFKLLSNADGQTVLIGNNGSNDFVGLSSSGSTITLYPSSTLNDGFISFGTPNTTAMVVNGTHKMLKFDPGTTAATVLAVFATASV